VHDREDADHDREEASTGVEINLGPCHYDGADDATMTAVHPDRIGWIAVCRRHAGKAEQEGYRVNEVSRGRSPASPYPAEPEVARPGPSGAEPAAQAKAGEDADLGADGGDLDVLDRLLGRSPTDD
jgi:hypothetical protein